MKYIAGMLLFLVVNLPLGAESTQKISVNFINPENFTDVALSGANTDNTRQYLMAKLRDYLVSLGSEKLPGGSRLTVDILDIDMAGRFEPWQTPQLINTRFIRDIYPPRIKLHYVLADTQGNTLADADDTLSNLTYLQNADPGFINNDPLRYEKTLLRRWFEQRFTTGNH